MTKKIYYKIIFLSAVFFLFIPLTTGAVSQGNVESFHIERNYDIHSRDKVDAILHKITNKIYFFVEKDWWLNLTQEERNLLDDKMYGLSVEFEYKIYPQMVSLFGSEPSHSIDDSGRISLLFHRMTSGAGGYVSSGDQYSKYQYPRSNEKNVIYINAFYAASPLLRGFLAHEFMHLITFYVKEKKFNVREEVWFNEARAEYMPTFFNYDSEPDNNLSRRKSAFVRNPENPLTEWLNRPEDYGSINMFVQYLVDHYGIEILSDSLKSDKVGIESINEALKKNNYQEDFSQIFTDWTIAALVNDCSLGEKYCYKNGQLRDLRIAPSTSYLPNEFGSSFSSKRSTKNWSGNWFRIVGGKGDLEVEFTAEGNVFFRVPYVICDIKDFCRINFIALENGKGKIEINDFETKYNSLTIIPSAQDKISGFNGSDSSVYFTWSVASVGKRDPAQERSLLVRELLIKIEELQGEVVRLQALLAVQAPALSCEIRTSLYFGLRGTEVKCLQEFLKKEGVYPEGLITGNFLELTRRSVVRFQEKYASEILHPLGLSQGTGYVGIKTREKINQISGL